MPLTHVFFDFFGTLVAFPDGQAVPEFRRSHAWLRANGADIDRVEFLERWTATTEEFEARAQESLDEYSMDAICGEFLRRVLPQAPDGRAVAHYRATFLTEWNQALSYIPGVPQLLAELARDYVLVVVSNTNDRDLVRGHLQAMGVADHFAAVITSVEHGRRKPSPCIFDLALARSGGKAESSVHVGDSFAADYVGATGAGLRGLLIDPLRRHDIPEVDRLQHVLDVRARLAG